MAQGRGVRAKPGARWSAAAFDVSVAVVVLLVSLVVAAGAGRSQPGTRPVDGWAYGLVAVSCAALVVRRRCPLPVAGVLGVALPVFAVRDYPGGPLVVAVMVALYTVVAASYSAAGGVVARIRRIQFCTLWRGTP